MKTKEQQNVMKKKIKGGRKCSRYLHVCVLSHFSCVQLCDPMLICPSDSPDKNTGVGCHALLSGIFPTQGSDGTQVSFISCIGKRVLYH